MARTKWPAAQHLQQAADQTREPDPNLDPEREHYTEPLGEWLDQVANDMAWLAPFREHEGGYRPWRTATRAAHGVLGLPDADTCPVCHPPRRPTTTRTASSQGSEQRTDTMTEAAPRLLDCGLCYEEHGEEIHPHPACKHERLAELEAEHQRWSAVHDLIERAINKSATIIDVDLIESALGPVEQT